MQTLVCFCFKIFFCERKDLTTGNDTFGLKLNRVNGHHILLWQPPNLSSFMLRMVSCRWQLNCITYAHGGTTYLSVMSKELQMWLGAALSGGHTVYMALPVPSPLRARATTKCETFNGTFPSVVLIDRTWTLLVGVKASAKPCRNGTLLSFHHTPVPLHPFDPDATLHAAVRG